MKPDYISRVITLFFTHSYPPKTVDEVQKWIVDEKWRMEKDRSLYAVWNKLQIQPDKSLYASLEKVKSTIGMKEAVKKRSVLSFKWLRYTAVVIPVLLFLGGYLYINREVRMIEVITLSSEQKQCTLPDGTVVQLNSCSKIIYPSGFSDTIRTVTLVGEAYFSVVPDAVKPFVVKTNHLSVKVLGTKFNICAYPTDDRSTATLNSGKIQVDVRTGQTDSHYVLKPSQQIVYNKTDESVLVNTVPTGSFSWKEGKLIFQESTFNDMMNTLERRYNVIIHYDKKLFANDSYSVKFINDEDVKQILNVLQDVVGGFEYEIRNNEITLIKKEGGR
ncbi:FecR family protein [Bacteroides sp. CG01]|uniref:FecR family protein n=1 Tax=Bacteroides sp. CG01 TaxID=3096000 RepID=UPI002AFE4790|nr:FecR domain-containing protein [Bacteroides sp. CG01]